MWTGCEIVLVDIIRGKSLRDRVRTKAKYNQISPKRPPKSQGEVTVAESLKSGRQRCNNIPALMLQYCSLWIHNKCINKNSQLSRGRGKWIGNCRAPRARREVRLFPIHCLYHSRRSRRASVIPSSPSSELLTYTVRETRKRHFWRREQQNWQRPKTCATDQVLWPFCKHNWVVFG